MVRVEVLETRVGIIHIASTTFHTCTCTNRSTNRSTSCTNSGFGRTSASMQIGATAQIDATIHYKMGSTIELMQLRKQM